MTTHISGAIYIRACELAQASHPELDPDSYVGGTVRRVKVGGKLLVYLTDPTPLWRLYIESAEKEQQTA